MDEGLKNELQKQGIFTTTLEGIYNWGRQNSIWPLQFGLACCAIEMIATSMARYDLARFGAEVFVPELAISLNNLSVILKGLGRREDALAAASEAVTHMRAEAT